MTKKRLQDILDEKRIAPDKYRLHAYEYLDEFLPLLEKVLGGTVVQPQPQPLVKPHKR